MNLARVYGVLLRLYPLDYIDSFERDMLAAFERAGEQARGRGRAVYARFALREFVSLAVGAGREWLAKSTTSAAVRGRALPDLRMMRPAGVPREAWFAAAPNELIEAERRTEWLVSRIVHSIAHHDFEGARRYSYQERSARERLRLLRKKHLMVE